jgi:hypothetical protein
VREPVSTEQPERSVVIRSTIMTTVLTIVFLTLAILFWAWSSADIVDETPVGWLRHYNEYILYVLEILFPSLTYVFLTTTVINVKLGFTGVRAGWTELVIILILIAGATYAMFGGAIMAATIVAMVAFIGYLYLLQK